MGLVVTDIIIPEHARGERLDSALCLLGAFESRSASAKAIEAGKVCVNGKAAAKRTIVQTDDVVSISQAEVVPQEVLHQAIPLDIRYEDDYLIVLSKQIGLVCHPDDKYYDNTLVNALINHCGLDHLCNLQGEDDRPGIVHRLDKNTSGLMLAAKTDEAGLKLMEAIRNREVDRRYLALVHGNLSVETGLIDAPIARSSADRKKMTVRDGVGSREATTNFKVLGRYYSSCGDFSYALIECKLNTGRTHQIRVHLEFAKHPLVGETVYRSGAPRAAAAQLGLERQFLHSYYLNFVHPITGVEMTFYDNLPEDLATALAATDPNRSSLTAYGTQVFETLVDQPHPSIKGEL